MAKNVMTVRKFIRENKDKYTNRKDFREACIKALDCHPRRFDDVLGQEGLLKLFPVEGKDIDPKIRRPKKAHLPPIKHKGIESFEEMFDKSVSIPKKIQEGIDTILLENHWMWDIDFRLRCDVSPIDWKRYGEEFEYLKVKTPGGKIAWGHPDYIDEMKRILNR